MNRYDDAVEKFRALLIAQAERVQRLKGEGDFTDYSALPVLKIGVIGGDGIGPAITAQAARVLEFLLEEEILSGKVQLRRIDGLTIENRVAQNTPLPQDILQQVLDCHVLLKGPTTTPQKGDGMPNLESANVALRKALDLFANVRPVKIPAEGVDWTFFRENTEGEYALGTSGIDVDGDMSFDFKVTTTQGTERIVRAAFEFAKNNGKTRVSAATKANVIKATDGKFLEIFNRVAAEYPDITADEWYADILTAKLIDQKRRRDFQVMVMPNLYGDIITDEAAELQGGVGTAGSANIGKRYAMFEAIHGSGLRMVKEGREKFADPSSIIRAAAMLLSHVGYTDKAARLERALEKCAADACPVKMTGRADGATGEQLADYLMQQLREDA